MEPYPDDRRYSAEHEWAVVETDGAIRIGISWYAQDALGDIVYVDLPTVGDHVDAGESIGEIESVKSVSMLYTPVSGTITAVNEEISARPELSNTDPYGAGWFIILTPDDPSEIDALMDADEYQRFAEGGD